MRRHRFATPALALTAVFAVAACQDTRTLTGPGSEADLQPQFSAQGEAPSQAALARQIPGFGGLFLDEEGVPTVYLKDVGQRAGAERALANFLRARGLQPEHLRVRRGAFDYLELARWFDSASPEVLADDGAVFVDLDEAANLVTVGVTDVAAEGRARAALARAGVPVAALRIVPAEPISFATTLREYVRPVQGGLQINFGNYLCTLGFNATSGGVASYITNSHCTNRQGGVEGTLHYQPLASTANSYIGVEVADPLYFKNQGCPKGKKCRYSDTSRGQYAGGVGFQLGQIAKTSSGITIGGFYTITAERADPLANETVTKVGRTTGTTSGRVTNTCVNTGVSGSSIVQLCQTFVSAGVGGGDSGSPVFVVSGGDNVTLYGILWGGNSSGTQFVFSPMSGIERSTEMGPLTTY